MVPAVGVLSSSWRARDLLAGEGGLSPPDYETVAHTFASASDLERMFRNLASTAVGAVGSIPAVPFSPHREFELVVRDLLDKAEKSCQILGRLSYETGEASRSWAS